MIWVLVGLSVLCNLFTFWVCHRERVAARATADDLIERQRWFREEFLPNERARRARIDGSSDGDDV
jgi:hypothetical protein